MRSVLIVAIFGLYGVTFVGSCIGFLVLNVMLRRRLRTHHATLWSQLGSPSSLDIALKRDPGRLWSWIWGRGYVSLDDTVTVRLASLVRSFGLVFFGSVGIAIVMMIVDRVIRVSGI